LVCVEWGIGLFVFLSVLLFNELPFLFLKAFEISGGHFGQLTLFQFCIVALPLLIPTTLMGVAFPIVAKLYLRDLKRVGTSIGKIYSANTVGGILGPLAASFLFIPFLGIQTSILSMGFLYIIIGFLLTTTHCHSSFIRMLQRGGLVALVLVGFLLLLIPSWDPRVISSGVYIYAKKYNEKGNNKEEALTVQNGLPKFQRLLKKEMVIH